MALHRAGVLVVAALLVAAGCRSSGSAAPHPSASTGSASAAPSQRAVSNEATKATAAGGSRIAGCPLFPADDIWNADVSHLRVDARSADYIRSIGASATLHPDFGAGSWQGTTMGFSVAYVKHVKTTRVTFDYAAESDKVGYPIPRDAPIEGGSNATGDRHVLLVDTGTCKLYELFDAHQSSGAWHAGSGAVFDLTQNRLRPAGWTSADAAGLPITPGLVRRDEVRAGRITHALRITVPRTAARYIWPARHAASGDKSAALPPMGLRLRLKAGVRISGFPRDAQVILRALKTYGAIVADNGSAWYLSGTNDAGWNNDVLHTLQRISGADFEAVDTTPLMADRDSGRVRAQ